MWVRHSKSKPEREAFRLDESPQGDSRKAAQGEGSSPWMTIGLAASLMEADSYDFIEPPAGNSR